jgi:hypothetical protein
MEMQMSEAPVTPPPGREQNNAPFQISIPGFIMAKTDLTITEKVVLSAFAQRPACSNSSLAQLTGLTVRGIEVLLARLRRLGLIHQQGKGCARRVTLFHEEHHIERGSDEPMNSQSEDRTNCGPAPGEKVGLEELFQRICLSRRLAASCSEMGDYESAQKHLARLRVVLEDRADLPEHLREQSLKLIEDDQTVIAGFSLLRQMKDLSKRDQAELAAALSNASSEQLQRFRERSSSPRQLLLEIRSIKNLDNHRTETDCTSPSAVSQDSTHPQPWVKATELLSNEDRSE